MSLSVLMDGLLNLNLHNGEQKDIHYFLHRLIVVKVNSMARHVESQIKGKKNVGRRGLTDKSVGLSTRRQGSKVRIPVLPSFFREWPEEKSREKVEQDREQA